MYQKFAVAEEIEHNTSQKKTVNSKIMGFYLFCFLPLHEVHTPDLIWVSKYYLLWKCNKNMNNLSMTFAVRLFSAGSGIHDFTSLIIAANG